MLDDVGHFVHIEQPDLVAGHGARLPRSRDARMTPPVPMLRHNRSRAGAAPPARRATAGRCCCCTASASAAGRRCRRGSTPGPARSSRSTSPATARRRSRSAAATPRRCCWPTPTPRWPSSGEATVVGRGLGAYVALQLAGARPADGVGRVLADGPGLAGGATFPTSQSFFVLPRADRPPDPYALVELTRDLRPPDYATVFVRLALAGSPLDEPITVAAVFRPAVARGRRRRARRRGIHDRRHAARATYADGAP